MFYRYIINSHLFRGSRFAIYLVHLRCCYNLCFPCVVFMAQHIRKTNLINFSSNYLSCIALYFIGLDSDLVPNGHWRIVSWTLLKCCVTANNIEIYFRAKCYKKMISSVQFLHFFHGHWVMYWGTLNSVRYCFLYNRVPYNMVKHYITQDVWLLKNSPYLVHMVAKWVCLMWGL